jgi:TRAP-type mannitol/chloroaromatic compound transport system permease large subunit
MRFAAGTVAGSSILGMLIPPSLLMIVYGVLAEVSIGQMFIAGVIPGVIIALGFIAMIWVYARFLPHRITRWRPPARAEPRGAMSGGEMAGKSVPILALVVADPGRALHRLLHADRSGRGRRRPGACCWRCCGNMLGSTGTSCGAS